MSATVGNVREVLARARERLGSTGRRTILFLDEIHRFNKAQQDALLPGGRGGADHADRRDDREPVLRAQLGAALADAALRARAARRRSSSPRSCGAARPSSASTLDRRGRARSSRGGPAATRARRSGSSSSPRRPRGGRRVGRGRRRGRGAQAAARSTTRRGDAHYDYISAWIKSTRASDVQASIYYLAVMLEGGEDARFIARRMIVLASEDIGNADPQALLVAVAAAQAVEHVGLPEARLQPRAGRRLPRARAEVERVVPRARRRDRRRPRARPPAPAGRAALGRVPGRAEARPRRGLRLPARRPGRIRGRQPPGRAQGHGLLRAVGRRRGDRTAARARLRADVTLLLQSWHTGDAKF